MTSPAWAIGIHHDGSEVYLSDPYPRIGETIIATLRTPQNAPIERAYLRVRYDGEFKNIPMHVAQDTALSRLWTCELPITQHHLSYRFRLITGEGAYYYTPAQGVSRADTPDSDNFVLVADYQAPYWVRECVFYQIFPDRFHNGDPSNDVQDGEWEQEGKTTRRRQWGESPLAWEKGRSLDFFGGDLVGIQQKLDYLTELGVNAIYLTPIFSSHSNHRYDVMDFFNIDKHLGGNEALIALRQAMDARNMKLMMDITTNHVGIAHHWFDVAKHDRTATEASYFIYNEEVATYETWLGVPTLLKLNYTSQALRDVMYRRLDSAMRRWLQSPYNLDAWRIDVANMTANYRYHQLAHEVWKEMRPALKQDNPQVYLLGEYFQDGTMHLQGDELDASMNYQGFNTPVRRWLGGEDLYVAMGHEGDKTLLPSDALVTQMRRFFAAVPFAVALQQFNQLDSHDTTRILHVVNEDKALHHLGVALTLAYVGVPCLYYGGEVGMTGGKDPDNRRCMDWDDSTWDNETLAHYKRWIALRKASPALKYGGCQFLLAEGDGIAFLRESRQQSVLFVGYRGAEGGALAIPAYAASWQDGTQLKDLLTGVVYTVQDGTLALETLAHGQAFALEVQAP